MTGQEIVQAIEIVVEGAVFISIVVFLYKVLTNDHQL